MSPGDFLDLEPFRDQFSFWFDLLLFSSNPPFIQMFRTFSVYFRSFPGTSTTEQTEHELVPFIPRVCTNLASLANVSCRTSRTDTVKQFPLKKKSVVCSAHVLQNLISRKCQRRWFTVHPKQVFGWQHGMTSHQEHLPPEMKMNEKGKKHEIGLSKVAANWECIGK